MSKSRRIVAAPVRLNSAQAAVLKVVSRIKKAATTKVDAVEAAMSMSRPDLRAGRGAAVPATAFTKAEIADSIVEKPSKSISQRWIYAQIERGASPADVLERAKERLKRSPTKSNLMLVQALMNEFARGNKSPLDLRKHVVQQDVNPFISKE